MTLAEYLSSVLPRNTDDVIVSDARYAKGMKLVECKSDGSGWKTRAMRLCDAMKGRYTGRENGYIMSPTKAMRFMKLLAEGWDAGYLGGIRPPEREHRESVECAVKHGLKVSPEVLADYQYLSA